MEQYAGFGDSLARRFESADEMEQIVRKAIDAGDAMRTAPEEGENIDELEKMLDALEQDIEEPVHSSQEHTLLGNIRSLIEQIRQIGGLSGEEEKLVDNVDDLVIAIERAPTHKSQHAAYRKALFAVAERLNGFMSRATEITKAVQTLAEASGRTLLPLSKVSHRFTDDERSLIRAAAAIERELDAKGYEHAMRKSILRVHRNGAAIPAIIKDAGSIRAEYEPLRKAMGRFGSRQTGSLAKSIDEQAIESQRDRSREGLGAMLPGLWS